MDATNMQFKTFNSFLQQIKTDYPDISFVSANRPWWDPDTRTVFYDSSSEQPNYSLMHELGHMQANHHSYKTDLELLGIEVEAWEQAKIIASKYKIPIDQDHIEDCIDSYRDWLHKRSSCPACYQTGIQNKERVYRCPNCAATWDVSPSRFCRPYRKKQRTPHNM